MMFNVLIQQHSNSNVSHLYNVSFSSRILSSSRLEYCLFLVLNTVSRSFARFRHVFTPTFQSVGRVRGGGDGGDGG